MNRSLGASAPGVSGTGPHRDEHTTALERIDTTVAHPARRYNYWLGGRDNFAPDRESGDRIAELFPAVVSAARENRAFLGRSVQFLAEQGVRQFLDIGTGLPDADNTHEVAQRIAADSRVVYVDNDPIVLTHARALLTGTDAGTVAYLDQDLRDPTGMLNAPALTATLDLAQPVGLLLVAVLHFIAEDEHPQHIVAELLDVLASGSYLVLSHGTADFLTDEQRAALPALTTGDTAGFHPRSRDELTGWLTGLDLIDPGLVSVVDWRPASTSLYRAEDIGVYGVVARKGG
ncbi:SAM-dependent methyltransferase [Dactylosporangium sp. AC04546]|uniref:SAM-dependent methyltransferase n=1 Tax=Dactylosporangium sp. AC04546 TaxID=2862460 RepID=UPI001EDCA044|nr:SAM-dependent methyltransferase [Dactylosporangium sp. AC04546]WVK78883.1 SAM-dependent methyltransferase [Dactylosporangium sp. AC04546]